MKSNTKFAVLVCLLFGANGVFAYEPGTHLKLSEEAAKKSVLGDNNGVLADLGLRPIVDAAQKLSDPQAGKTIALGPNNTDPFIAKGTDTILNLIGTGAALEDEFPRSLFHFYDPAPGHFDPLNIKDVPVPYSAPDWALADSLLPVAGQSYSLEDAKDYFDKALTSTSKTDRESAFGGLFLTLGHVIHLLQDVAQPQHVRNDMHCDADICKHGELVLQEVFNKKLPLYNPSRYEAYTYDSANVGDYGGYTPVDQPLARDYWGSSRNKGLAQFTNQNFVSAGTNFRVASNGDVLSDTNYALPVPTSISGSVSIDDVYKELGKTVPKNIADYCTSIQQDCGMQFVTTDVFDSYLDTVETNSRASSYSIFNQDLERNGSQKLFALNALNFQYDWKYLLPRAIGYSAGLIDHFFRGRLDVQPDPNTPEGYLVINKSSYPMSDGTLTLYYDDADGNRYPVPGASWSSVTIPAAGSDAAAEYPIKFSAPMDPAPATSGEYILVFQGKIGSEAGVAAKLFTEVSSNYVYAGWNSSNCGWFGSCTSGVKVFDSTFNLHSASPLGLPIYNLVVYDGKEYALVELPNCAYSVLLEGVAIADSTLTWCGNRNSGEVFDIDTLGVNSHYLYIFKSNFTVVNTDSGQRMNYNYESVDRYDHKGNYVSTIAKLPVGTIGEASVNDTRMCLAAWSADFASSVALLADLDGNTVANFPLTNQSDYVSCALAADRAYVLDDPFEGGDPILNVYDMNGSAKASFTISGIKNYALWGVFAHNSYIYVMVVQADYSNSSYVTFIHKAAIYDREVTRDSEGNITSESFSRRPDVTIPELPYSYSINFALDMKDVLGALKN